MAGVSEFATVFTLNGALDQSFNAAFAMAGQKFEGLNKSIGKNSDSIKNLARTFSEFQAKSLKISESQNALTKYREQFKLLQKQAKETGMTPKIQGQMQHLGKLINSTENNLKSERKALNELRGELKASGISTEDFGKAQQELTRRSEEAVKAQNKLVEAQERQQKRLTAMKNLKDAAMTSYVALQGLKSTFGQPVNVAANFEQQMANVRAVTGMDRDDENFLKLEAQAREQGRLTQFSQVQVGQAQENLIRAGMNAEQVIGAIPGVLAMASAEGMELAQASEIISQSLSQFEYNADQASRISNILAGASAAANTNISMMGASLQKVGTQAKSFHMSAEQAATDLAAMANTGLRGEEAGTSYQSLLTHLSRDTSQQALNNLGVAVKDREGRLRRSEFLYKDLAEKLKGKGDLEINNILSGIFGDRGIRAARALMSSVQSGSYANVQEQINSANTNNAAGKMSEIRNDTLQGKITSMQSAMEGFLERVGRPLMKALEPIVDGLTKIINLATDLMDKFPALTDGVILFAGAFATLKAASTIMGIISAVKNLAGSFGVLNAVMNLNPLFTTVAIGAGIIAGIWAIYENWDKCCEMFNNVWSSVCDGISSYWDGIVNGISNAWNSNWDKCCEMFNNAWISVCDGISSYWDGIVNGISNAWNSNWDKCCEMFNNAWISVCDGISSYWDGIVNGISNAWNSFISTVSFGLIGSSEQASAAVEKQQQNAINAMDMAWGAKEHYAAGGIISHPEIAMIGEAGPEAILPLNNPRRSFEILGESGLLNNNTSQSVKTFNIAPVINVSGDNNNDLRYEIFEIVKQAMQDIQNESERLAYS